MLLNEFGLWDKNENCLTPGHGYLVSRTLLVSWAQGIYGVTVDTQCQGNTLVLKAQGIYGIAVIPSTKITVSAH